MKTITYSDIDAIKFSKYGYICSLLKPDGERITDNSSTFFRDMIQLGNFVDATASVCQLSKRPMIIEGAEYHSACGEVIVPLDGDIIIPMAPALPDQRSPADHFEAFYLKKGTMVYLRQGVWHSAAFPVDTTTVNLLIILPERTYAKDCHMIGFSGEECIKVEAA